MNDAQTPPQAPSTPAEALAAFGLKSLRPLRDRVIVFVPAPARVTPNGLILTDRESWTLRGLPHQYLVKALVVSVGSEVTDLQAGEWVFFPRSHWGWLFKMQGVDGLDYLGYIQRQHLAGRLA